MSKEIKVIGFQRIGSGDWYILDDGTKISTGDGDRILRFIRTVQMERRSLHLNEALGYIKAYATKKATELLYAMATKVNKP